MSVGCKPTFRPVLPYDSVYVMIYKEMSLEEYCILKSFVLKCGKKYGEFSEQQAVLFSENLLLRSSG